MFGKVSKPGEANVLQSRWIIVEEDILAEEENTSSPQELALSQDTPNEELALVGSNTQVCARFEDKELAECSLNSLIDVETPKEGEAHFIKRTNSGFISVGENTERVCYITSLH